MGARGRQPLPPGWQPQPLLLVGFCLVLSSASQGTAGPFLDERAEPWHWVPHLTWGSHVSRVAGLGLEFTPAETAASQTGVLCVGGLCVF